MKVRCRRPFGLFRPPITLIASHPRNVTAYFFAGTMEELYGRPQRAEDGYRKALQVKPDLGAAANTLAYLMLENRESTDEALYLARIARQRMPDSPSTADTLAWAYYQKAHYDMAASTARSRAEGAQQCHVPVPYWNLSEAEEYGSREKTLAAYSTNQSKFSRCRRDS